MENDLIKKGIERGKQRYRCKRCAKEISHKFYENNKQLVLNRKKQWKINNPEKQKISHRKSLIKNRHKYREGRKLVQREYVLRHPETKKRYNSNKVNKIYDSYVIDILRRGTELKSCDIPQPLIETKRALLQLSRKIRERKKNTHENR